MTLFSSINISGTGVDAMQTWIDTAGGNIANANDVVATNAPAYATETPVFTPVGGTLPGAPGAGVSTSVALGSTAGVIVSEPGNPLANAQGEVKVPSVSLGDQLVGLIQAQEGYQANTVAITHAVAAYQSGLAIGS
ncbi:MAG: flagellar basal body rod protein FlgC [Acidimicrobiales bacterium]